MLIINYKSSNQHILWIIFILTLLSFILLPIITSKKVGAVYQSGNIIDDSLFLDAKSMSKEDIQNFLIAKNSGLRNMSFTLQCYSANSAERQWYTAAGAQCDTLIPASHIIYYAAQIYGISPKVILATMQKEQSLTTAPNPTTWQLTQAMGYACPTSGSCSTSSSFPYQIDAGTWALRKHYERARGNMTWWSSESSWVCGVEKSLYKPNLYPGQNVRFYDTNGTQYATVYINNAATSSMYCYTPHVYNNPQGLYNKPTQGTTGLYYSGSYNFVYFYELWFGSTSAGANDPMGNLETLQPVQSGIRLAGWGFDRGTPTPASIHVYIDGKWGGGFVVNKPRQDVANVFSYLGVNSNTGFDEIIPYTTPGTHQVCTWLVGDSIGAPNANLGCKNVIVYADPMGNLETLQPVQSGIRLAGWGFDRGTPTPASIHVYIDGKWGGGFVVNKPRQDVANVFSYLGVNSNTGFDEIIPYTTPGTHQVCTWLVGDSIGAPNANLGCKNVAI